MGQEVNDRAETAIWLRAFDVKRREARIVVWSCAHFFFLMAGYYIIRPIRDAMGLTRGVEDLAWLFLATLVVMLLVNPAYSALVSRFSPKVFVPAVYVFFVVNLLLFFILFRRQQGGDDIYLARTFFVWVSIFNLFIVSVFWGTMADFFSAEQGKRLFGLIGVGGTLGAIVGAAFTALFAGRVGEINLLPAAVALLSVACLCAMRLNRLRDSSESPYVDSRQGPTDEASVELTATRDQRIGGTVTAGITHVLGSAYLLGIFAFIGFHTFSGTFAYFLQGSMVEQTFEDRDARTTLFAYIDVLASIGTGVIQVFLTGRIIKRFGVGWTLALLPLVVIVGFIFLDVWPTMAVLVLFQVVRRATNFALARPARECLFTVLPREDKYKAKNFVDTFAFRSGDALGAVSFVVLAGGSLDLGLRTILLLAVTCWLPLALFLGYRQRRMRG